MSVDIATARPPPTDPCGPPTSHRLHPRPSPPFSSVVLKLPFPSSLDQVRVPFLEFMTALASGEYGASMVLRQMAEMSRLPGYEMLTWRKLFTAIIEYCIRWVWGGVLSLHTSGQVHGHVCPYGTEEVLLQYFTVL